MGSRYETIDDFVYAPQVATETPASEQSGMRPARGTPRGPSCPTPRVSRASRASFSSAVGATGAPSTASKQEKMGTWVPRKGDYLPLPVHHPLRDAHLPIIPLFDTVEGAPVVPAPRTAKRDAAAGVSPAAGVAPAAGGALAV